MRGQRIRDQRQGLDRGAEMTRDEITEGRSSALVAALGKDNVVEEFPERFNEGGLLGFCAHSATLSASVEVAEEHPPQN
jgi:hypothetical protein